MREPSEIWNELLARRSVSGEASLTADEEAVLRVNIFAIEVENGGLSGALYNLSPTDGSEWIELRMTASAADIVCSHQIGNDLREIAQLVEAASRVASGTTWSNFLASVDVDGLTKLSERVAAHVSELWDELETFTVRKLMPN